jgi:uncharacterized protein
MKIADLTRDLQQKGVPAETLVKWQALTDRLASFDSVLVAYSGGVDSTFLTHAAHWVLGEKSCAVFIQAEMEAGFQTAQAERWAEQGGFGWVKLHYQALEDPRFAANPVNRCYFCKLSILGLINQYAREHNFAVVLEGQNKDDQKDYRPGRQAVIETGTLSPLAEVGLTKAEIRSLAKALGLPVWDQPSSPCLASRFPYGLPITRQGLERVEKGEDYLHQLGFAEVRVRIHQDLARIEVSPEKVLQLVALGAEVSRYFKKIGFLYVAVDLQGYRQGSLNEGIVHENSLL